MKRQESIPRIEKRIGKITDKTRKDFIELATGTSDGSQDLKQAFPILDPEADGDNWVTTSRVLMPYLRIGQLCLPLFGKENIVEGVVSYTRPIVKEWVVQRVGEDAFWEIRTHYRRPKCLDSGLVYDPKAKHENVLITDDVITWINETYQNYTFNKNQHAVLIVGDRDKAFSLLANYSWINGCEKTVFRRK